MTYDHGPWRDTKLPRYPTRIGFTGSRTLSNELTEAIQRAIFDLPTGSLFISGGCIGADYIAMDAADLRGLCTLLILPANRSQVDTRCLSRACFTIEMPPGTTYRDRNYAIVDRSDRLLVAPSGPMRSQPRSGTWMTYRIAKAFPIPTDLIGTHWQVPVQKEA